MLEPCRRGCQAATARTAPKEGERGEKKYPDLSFFLSSSHSCAKLLLNPFEVRGQGNPDNVTHRGQRYIIQARVGKDGE